MTVWLSASGLSVRVLGVLSTTVKSSVQVSGSGSVRFDVLSEEVEFSQGYYYSFLGKNEWVSRPIRFRV